MKRPVIRYFGGKYRLVEWITSYFPKHKVYTEPFGGAASVLLRKERCYAEIYNDLDGEVVNVFRVLRDPEKAKELERLIYYTPFARDEYDLAFQPTDNDVEQARRSIIKTFLTHGSDSMARKSGFRVNSNRSGAHPAKDWSNYPQYIKDFSERLRGVAIENRNAIEVILQHDSPDTLHYIDPPYVHETRTSARGYKHEMTTEQHKKLAMILGECVGKVIVSGYPSSLYEEIFCGWNKAERQVMVTGNHVRTESLYMNFDFTVQQNLFPFDSGGRTIVQPDV